MNYEPLDFQEGSKNIPGLRPIGYFGFTSEADYIPELPSAPTDMSDAGVITENIVMKAGKTMYPMYGTFEKLQLAGESQGERDARTKRRTITWKYPDTDPLSIGFDIATNNRNMFFIVTDNNGRHRLVGNKFIPASISSNDDTGMGIADDKGYTYEIYDHGIGSAPIYNGDLPVDSGLLDLSSDNLGT